MSKYVKLFELLKQQALDSDGAPLSLTAKENAGLLKKMQECIKEYDHVAKVELHEFANRVKAEKPVYSIDFYGNIKTYKNVTQAAEELNISSSNVRNACTRGTWVNDNIQLRYYGARLNICRFKMPKSNHYKLTRGKKELYVIGAKGIAGALDLGENIVKMAVAESLGNFKLKSWNISRMKPNINWEVE